MYKCIAGIAPLEAGYKKTRIAPQPNAPLTSASGSLNTPYGKVSSSWKIKNNEFQLETTIPPNTTATIVILANTNEELFLNGEIFQNTSTIKLINKSEKSFELLAQPGTYHFKSKIE